MISTAAAGSSGSTISSSRSAARSLVGIELERGAQVLDRGRGLAEHDHRLAGLGPRVGRADRIALVLRPRRAQLGEQLAAAGVAQLLAQLREAAGLRLLAEDHDPRLERIDSLVRQRVVGHPRAGATIPRSVVEEIATPPVLP